MIENNWIPKTPTKKQSLFLSIPAREILYGGAAGGGKTEALLASAAQYLDIPNYSALILRSSFPDLNQPDGLIPRSQSWWGNTAAEWSAQSRRWKFPCANKRGFSTITFGYLSNDNDVYQYQGARYQFIGIDELTQHTEQRYTYLFSRLRKPSSGELSIVPLRMRATTNPGGKGHEWVKKRFIPSEYFNKKTDEQFSKIWKSSQENDRVFIPARLEDNPYLDSKSYEQSLQELLPIERDRLRYGDWSAHSEGHIKREWLQHYTDLGDAYYLPYTKEIAKHYQCEIIICVDPAGGISENSDYTAIIVAGLTPKGSILILEVVREKIAVENVVPRIAEVCKRWKPSYIGIESEFSQSAYARQAKNFSGIPTVKMLSTEGKSKLVRATPMIVRMSQREIFLPLSATWLDDYIYELCSFTGIDDTHDDQVDATAYIVLCFDKYKTKYNDSPVTFGRRGE